MASRWRRSSGAHSNRDQPAISTQHAPGAAGCAHDGAAAGGAGAGSGTDATADAGQQRLSGRKLCGERCAPRRVCAAHGARARRGAGRLACAAGVSRCAGHGGAGNLRHRPRSAPGQLCPPAQVVLPEWTAGPRYHKKVGLPLVVCLQQLKVSQFFFHGVGQCLNTLCL